MQDKVVESGTMIIKQGDDGDVLYVIEEGCAAGDTLHVAGWRPQHGVQRKLGELSVYTSVCDVFGNQSTPVSNKDVKNAKSNGV